MTPTSVTADDQDGSIADTVQDLGDGGSPTVWSRSDLVGIGLSVLCAIHCAAMPFLIALLPTLGLGLFEAPWVHQTLFVGCFALAMMAVLRGFRVHRRRRVPVVAASGLGLLAASAFVWPAPCCASPVIDSAGQTAACCEAGCCSAKPKVAETEGLSETQYAAGLSSASLSLTDLWLRLMTPLGGGLLIVAHLLNLKFVRSCRCQCCAE